MINNNFILKSGNEFRGTMIKIIICDDDSLFVEKLMAQIKPLFQGSSIPLRINTFSCAEEIGAETLSACDIAFLDIDFASKSYNGIDIARRIRTYNQDAVIVFITNYLEYAPEGYEVQAFRYILKNELSKKIEESIHQIITYIRSAKANIKIQANGEIIDLPLKDINYIESMGHTVIIHLISKKKNEDRQCICYSTLAKKESELSERGFIRVHKSYLVNMNHIKKFNCFSVILDSGVELPVSSKKYSENKRIFLLWRGKN